MATIGESLRRWWLRLGVGTRRSIGAAIVITAVVLIYLAASPRTGTDPSVGTPGARDAAAVLNEILFLPAPGQSEFIELKALADDAAFAGWTVTNEQKEAYVLPPTTPRIDAGEFLLVIFDGGNAVDGHTVHAERRAFLSRVKGSVQLADTTGRAVDYVAWGRGQPGGVNLGRGGALDELAAGAPIGRFRQSVKAHDFLEWLTFAKEQVTPGLANPNPNVEILLPIDGAFFSRPSIELGWYPVAGATRYRVQIASDSQFAQVIEDQVADAPSFTTPELRPGEYFWRVQAVFADDSVAALSPPSSFTISVTEFPTESPHAARTFFSSAYAADTIPPLREGVLAVPMIYQQKDTAMLLLESMTQSGPHAWDVAHPGLDPDDPADNMNCALASIVMVNHFAHGTVSQDRLGYELRKGDWPNDPAWDLNYGQGLYDDDIDRMLAFAFNGATAAMHTVTTADALWDAVTADVDAERPVVAKVPGHAIVISGYYQFSHTGPNARFLTINDPWRGRYLVNLSRTRLTGYWLLSNTSNPRRDEAEITTNSDDDGIVDFDEVNRFKTQRANRDSDHDGVDDKTEVYATVFDPTHGHAQWRRFGGGRDFDEDVMFMELDADSDAGGCKDGQEDKNANGKRDAGETYNFDKQDDDCGPPPLGGHVHMTYAYAATREAICVGRVTIDSRFTLDPVIEPSAAGIVHVFRASAMTYDIRTDGCPDYPGDHNVYTFDQGIHSSGTIPLTDDGYAMFLPAQPQFSMLLPSALTLGPANTMKGSYTAAGGGPWPAETSVVFEPLQVVSDPSHCNDPADPMHVRNELLEFCTEPTPCADQPNAPLECFTEPQRYYVVPFKKSFHWAPPNEPGRQYHIGDADVTVEICEGCGGRE